MGRDSIHDDGQRDGAQNDYDPPVPMTVLTVLTTDSATLAEWQELNDRYDAGWTNGYNNR